MDGALAGINYWAVGVAAISAFFIGGLWYSPVLFGKVWMRETGLSEDDLAAGNPGVIYGGSFLLALIASLVFAIFLGPAPALPFAAGAGFMAGVAWVGTSFGINYLFERKSLKLFFVNAGYHTVQFLVIGVILGLWH